jgi:hypothetical protein
MVILVKITLGDGDLSIEELNRTPPPHRVRAAYCAALL